MKFFAVTPITYGLTLLFIEMILSFICFIFLSRTDLNALKEYSCWLVKYLPCVCLTWFCSLIVIVVVCGWCLWNLMWSWIIFCTIRLSVFWFPTSSFAFVLKSCSISTWACYSMSNFFFCSLYYIDTNFLFTNLQIALWI